MRYSVYTKTQVDMAALECYTELHTTINDISNDNGCMKCNA